MDLELAYMTFPDIKAAEFVVEQLLRAKAIACANIVPGVTSHYWWNDNLQKDQEVLVFAKTTQDKRKMIEEVLLKHHSYEVPCLVFYSAESAFDKYEKWIKSSLT